MKKHGRIFLGGTCNKSKWREQLIAMFDEKVRYFNPVVDDWTPQCQLIEKQEKRFCDVELYTITPLMLGVFSIAEVINATNKRNSNTTVLCLLKSHDGLSFNESEWKSLLAVASMVIDNDGLVYFNLEELAKEINESHE
jgi:hypothetical protein